MDAITNRKTLYNIAGHADDVIKQTVNFNYQ